MLLEGIKRIRSINLRGLKKPILRFCESNWFKTAKNFEVPVTLYFSTEIIKSLAE